MKEYEDKVVVPQRWECGKSTWDQFMESHPNLECLMEFSTARLSEALFDVFGPIDTLAVLKQTRFLHPYNMFVGNRSFYQEWVNVLDKLIPAIEDEAARMIDKLGVRWGGYIMERLFSTYLHLCRIHARWDIVELPVILFK